MFFSYLILIIILFLSLILSFLLGIITYKDPTKRNLIYCVISITLVLISIFKLIWRIY